MPRALFSCLLSLALTGCVSLAPVTGELSPPKPAPAIERKAEGDAPSCPIATPRTVLVIGFPLRYPEQIPYGGYVGWPQATAAELARTLAQGKRLRANAAPQRVLFEGPDAEKTAAGWAHQSGAQFVLSGSFRDFAVIPGSPLGMAERHLVIEAAIREGEKGSLIAWREFAWKLPVSWELPQAADPGPGTREFAATRFGRLYHALLDEIARWAEEEITCRKEPIPRPKPRAS